ncbi:MAG TPA: hypothetical protein VF041_16420 [Gemmatimonadaceae bacterium]
MRSSPHRPIAAAVLLGVSLLAAIAPPARAQRPDDGTHRTPRSTIFAIVGTILGGVAGYAYTKAAKGGGAAIVAGAAAGGGIFGYFIGREYDVTYRTRYHGLPPLHPPSISVDLEGEPTSLDAGDSTIAVAGSDGVELFSEQDGLRAEARRAGGLRGIGTVAIAPRSRWLALGSPAGLYLYPPRVGPGTLVREGDVGATAATSERVFFGVGDRVEIAPFGADTTRAWPGTTLGATVRALVVDSARALLLASTDRELVALRVAGDSLERVGGVTLDGVGRRLAATHDTVAVALGEHGVALYDTSNPASPRPLATWTTALFAYDVAFTGSRLYVAAGPEGVYVLDVGDGTLRTLGLARGLGFASALATDGRYTYILDRRSNALRRIQSAF